MSEPLVALREVWTELPIDGRPLPVIRGIDLSVGRGEIVGLVGESGSGKSLTARTIFNLLPRGARVRGEVRFDGVDLLSLSRPQVRALRRTRMSMVFQDPRATINPLRTCGSQLSEVLHVNRELPKAAALARAGELLGDVGIVDVERVLRAYPTELSGGMLQRVLIAMALASEPDFIVADEPTTALDVTTQAEIVGIFDELRRTRELALLFITHDLELAAALCDRIVVMYAGRIAEAQPTAKLFAAPAHPYTAALLGARPALERRSERLPAIPGRPPSPDAVPPGCPFHPRCPHRRDACVEELPALLPRTRRGALTACLRASELEAEPGHSEVGVAP
jgi:oligopeptide/dipeptide ABC transporter ATP-binding protein